MPCTAKIDDLHRGDFTNDDQIRDFEVLVGNAITVEEIHPLRKFPNKTLEVLSRVLRGYKLPPAWDNDLSYAFVRLTDSLKLYDMVGRMLSLL